MSAPRTPVSYPTMPAPAIPKPRTRLFDHNKYWAECFGVAGFLPTSREEVDQLGWDSCDIVIVTGPADSSV